ncbi:hypothetical protein M0802_010995 [Mischocyttarus mexicanus]|nr:hypothetical protein M0802_010995 [Mischocyttarus mexicanus]
MTGTGWLVLSPLFGESGKDLSSAHYVLEYNLGNITVAKCDSPVRNLTTNRNVVGVSKMDPSMLNKNNLGTPIVAGILIPKLYLIPTVQRSKRVDDDDDGDDAGDGAGDDGDDDDMPLFVFNFVLYFLISVKTLRSYLR